MTSRLLLSFALIALTLAGVTGATLAYFSDSKVLGANTFQTGNVALGDFNVASLNVTGLAPGKTVTINNVGINYIGNINADLYLGARGEKGPGEPGYIADKTYLKIKAVGTSTVIWEGWVNQLSTGWRQIAANIGPGWQAYDLEFTLSNSAGRSYQNVTNTDTQILMYAIQSGGPVPSTAPFLTTGGSGSDWAPAP